MTDTSTADTGPFPVFSANGTMQGNLTSIQGQPPAAAPEASPAAPGAAALAPQSPLAALGPPPAPTAGPPPDMNINFPPQRAIPQTQKIGPAPDAQEFHKNALAFASAMAVLGAVSSKFTRMSGTQALSAFAGALNGWQQGNLQAYDQAAKKWEQDTKATIENNKQILDDYKLTLENDQLNIDEQMAEIRLKAVKWHDQMSYDAAAQNNFTFFGKVFDKNWEYTYGEKGLEATTAPLMKENARITEQMKLTAAQVISGQINPNGIDPKTGQPYTEAQKLNLKYIVQNYGPLAGKKSATLAGGRSPEDIDRIVDGIASGKQPPVLTGLYGASAAVRSKLQEKGIDLSQLQIEWQRAQKQIQALNGPQMTRFVGLAQSVDSTIDAVRERAEALKQSGVPLLNHYEMLAYIKTRGNTPTGQLYTKYLTDVNTLKEEFANLAQGGYAPTEPVWKLANDQINGDYGVDQMGASLEEVQRLIRFRINAIPGLNQVGPGAPNRYTGQSATATAAAPAGGVPIRVQSPADAEKLAPGTHYVTPDGQEYVR